MDKFNLKGFINENNLGAYSKLESKTLDIYDDGDVVVDISKATPEQERLIRWETDPDNGISEFGGSEDAQEFADQIMQLNSVEDVEKYYENVRGWDDDSDLRGMIRHAIDAYRGIDEQKGKDHDGDGDIDSDDYVAAKDKAIKKAMNKNENITEATDIEVVDIISEILLKLSDGNTTARQAAFEVAKERGVSFNLILQQYQKKGGELQDIDFETLKEYSKGGHIKLANLFNEKK